MITKRKMIIASRFSLVALILVLIVYLLLFTDLLAKYLNNYPGLSILILFFIGLFITSSSVLIAGFVETMEIGILISVMTFGMFLFWGFTINPCSMIPVILLVAFGGFFCGLIFTPVTFPFFYKKYPDVHSAEDISEMVRSKIGNWFIPKKGKFETKEYMKLKN